MVDPKKQKQKQPTVPPPRTDVRFDYVDKLPPGVPPVELPPTSMFPYPPPIGPGTATYYFPLNLGLPDGNGNATGVFFPSGFAFPDKFNVILYFHGHKQGDFKTINQYWAGKLHNIRLRHDVNESGKQVVLIAPTMGESPGSALNADMGIFRDPGGADGFLAEVARWIRKYVPQYIAKGVTPGIGNIVLAGHSGAGAILSQQAKTMKSHICEVWGFDSMYAQGYTGTGRQAKPIDVTGDWKDAALKAYILEFEKHWGLPIPKLKPTTHFYFYWAEAVLGVRSNKLQEMARKAGLTNVTVKANAHVGLAYHFDTVTRNFKTRVAAASCF